MDVTDTLEKYIIVISTNKWNKTKVFTNDVHYNLIATINILDRGLQRY